MGKLAWSVCAFFGCAAAWGQVTPVERLVDGQAQALPFDGTRLAVSALGDRDDVAHALGNPSDLESLGVPGWWLASTNARTPQGVRSSLDELTAAGDVEFAAPVFIDTLGKPLVPTQHVLVRFDENSLESESLAVLEALDVEVAPGAFGGMERAYRVTVPSRVGFDAMHVANVLAARDDVAWAEVDWIFTGTSSFTPSDTLYSDQWALSNTGQFSGVAGIDLGAELAWDVTKGDPTIITLVLDVGVQQGHPDLNLVGGVDVTTNGPGSGGPVNVCDNHGTPVAGCISAIGDNALGVSGIAPETKVSSARAFISTLSCDGSWTSQASWTVDALTFGESINVRVTNNSNFYGFSSAAIADKYTDTRTNGMVHFASLGNGAVGFATYPAILSTVNGVGAIQSDGQLASFSNFGPDVALVAPGVMVLSTDRQGAQGYDGSSDYVFVDGTSFASPYTAGVAALVLSVDRSLSAAAVEATLRSTAIDLGTPGFDNQFGDGLVNATNALEPLAGPFGTWADEGFALAGTLGNPELEGTGLLIPGTPTTLTLDNVASGLPASLVIGTPTLFAPFKGGVLVPTPLNILNGFMTTAGPLDLSGTWAPGLPSGLAIAYQFWIADAGGAVGFAASNAVSSTTP